MVGWSDLRAAARRTVHATFGEPFAYTAPDGTVTTLTVRYRTRQDVIAPFDSEYANVVESANRLVFSSEDLADKGVTLQRGGRVAAPPFLFELDQPEPLTGPVEVPWTVTDVTHAG